MSVQNVIIKQDRKVPFIATENQSMKVKSIHAHNVNTKQLRKDTFRDT